MDVGRSIFRAIADFSGIRREARSTGSELQKMQRIAAISGNLAGKKFATGFIKGLLKLALIAPIIAAISAAALSGAASLLTLAGSLGALLGLGVAVPAVIGGLVVGVAGLAMALKDTKKYLGDLAPGFAAVQKSVSAKFWESAAKPIRSMVQTLLPELKTGLTGVGGAWGTVAASGANAMKAALKNGPLKKMMEDTRVGIAGLAPAMWPIVHALTNLGAVGTTYLPQLSAWIVKLSERFDRFIESAKQTGKLDEWLKGGVQALKDLWVIGRSVGGIFGALTKAAQASGANSTLTTLATGLERISNMMNGPAFQKAMTTIFMGANAGAEGLLKSLGPVGDAFERGAPALAKFLELGGQIVGILIGGLADALSNPAFGVGLIAFMEGVKAGATALAPILPVISTAFGVMLAALAPVIATLLPALGVTIAELAGTFAAVLTVLSPVLTVLAAMAPVLVPLGLAAMVFYKSILLWSQLKNIVAVFKSFTLVQTLLSGALGRNTLAVWRSVTSWIALKVQMIAAKAVAMGSWIAGIIAALGRKIAALALAAAAWVAQKAAIVAAMAVSAASWVAGIVADLGRKIASLALAAAAWVAQKAAIVGAMAVSAAGWVLGIITALAQQTAALAVNAAAWVWQKLQVMGAMAVAGASALWGALTALAAQTGALIINAAAWVAQKAVLVAGAIVTGIATAAQWALNAAMMANPIVWIIALIVLLIAALVWFFTQTDLGRSIWSGFMSFLSDAFTNLQNWWNDMWNNMVRFMQEAGANIGAWLSALPGNIMAWLGDMGSLLVGAGQALIQGFIDGLNGMIGAVQGAVGGIMDIVGSFFPNSPAKKGAFSGKGWTPFRGKALMSGFANGIVDDGSAVLAADAAMGKIASTMTLDPKKLMAPSYSTSAALKGQAPVNSNAAATSLAPAPSAGDRNLNVTVNNPAPEAPSQSIQKTYSKVAYLGLDAKEPVGV